MLFRSACSGSSLRRQSCERHAATAAWRYSEPTQVDAREQNCIWGPTRPVAVPGWGLVQTTAAMFLLYEHIMLCRGHWCHTVLVVIA